MLSDWEEKSNEYHAAKCTTHMHATHTQMAMDVITVFTNLLKSMDEELKAKIALITPLQPNITKVFCVLLLYCSFWLLHFFSLVVFVLLVHT